VRAACATRITRWARGHTLLELLIATALGLFVIGGAIMLYRAQREALLQAADAASMRDAGATALTLIGQHLQMAGYAPPDQLPGDAANHSAVTPAIFGCSSARPRDDGLVRTCDTHAGYSDGVAVRYVGDVVSTWSSTTGQATDCLGQGIGLPGERAVVINKFYVGGSSRSAAERELYCEGNGNVRIPQPIVAGVDRLTIRYWRRGASIAVDASSIGPSGWGEVIAVDVCVLVRGALTTHRGQHVDCDGVAATSSDRRARQAFWRHFALRNQDGGL
jgi:type IV pilus assembly protein PilW